MSLNPSWPSFYNPAIELAPFEHRDAMQAGGYYLTKPSEVFRFTLYWMFIFHVPLLMICGTYAFFNLTFPPSRQTLKSTYPLPTLGIPDSSSEPEPRLTPPRTNERRSRLTFAIIVFLGFAFISIMNALVGALVVGYVLAGVYHAAGFHMSTWVPFIWAIITVLLSYMGIWPSVIEII
ncbi:hypothetical protein FIBSPDRAFT_945812 [Athelia psychrophila]|uniref:Integral membrane protein n=1 Tax=Athelia psychrophila TaxID=1759441 RepID=A0A166C335_9AGAM|nr:hypothetical protein FIBSPDRAFT_753782 [Fibularhizoctonia sp. CBS 109695]KZP30444.1 hypothetical protein FIBSPDRAFT_945812 [Fibularhizoctonia sp. CBS 109695]